MGQFRSGVHKGGWSQAGQRLTTGWLECQARHSERVGATAGINTYYRYKHALRKYTGVASAEWQSGRALPTELRGKSPELTRKSHVGSRVPAGVQVSAPQSLCLGHVLHLEQAGLLQAFGWGLAFDVERTCLFGLA